MVSTDNDVDNGASFVSFVSLQLKIEISHLRSLNDQFVIVVSLQLDIYCLNKSHLMKIFFSLPPYLEIQNIYIIHTSSAHDARCADANFDIL